MKWLPILLLLLGACAGDLDEQWQLDHDRIIVVRAEPPGILSGETSVIDALIGVKGGHPFEASPEAATVISPMSLASAVHPDAGRWVVTAPDAAALAAARQELMLDANAPVPLSVGVSYANQTLLGFKTVWLGESRSNPTLTAMMINGAAPPATDIVVPMLEKVPLSIDATVPPDTVNWLTSCGTMHDFDLPQAYLKVEKDDPTEGDFAVVLRKEDGGVAWQTWTIHAQ